MAQLQAEVPDPLRDDLPGFLSAGRMATPAIRVLLGIFIGKSNLEGPTMQVEGHDIGSGESMLGQLRQEQLVDDAVSFDAHAALRLRSRMVATTTRQCCPNQQGVEGMDWEEVWMVTTALVILVIEPPYQGNVICFPL